MNSTTTAPKERPAETRSVDTLIEDAPSVYPYPRWWSSVERGCLFALSTGVLANVIFLFASRGDVEMARLIMGILGVRALSHQRPDWMNKHLPFHADRASWASSPTAFPSSS